MNDNIDILKDQISEHEKEIINLYKDLITSYEALTSLNENILQDTSDVIKCSGIYAQNKSATVTRWTLIKLDGTMMYQSDKYAVNETCKIDLRKQNRVIGTQFKLHANDVGKDSTSNIILEYDPNADFVKFELRGTVFHTWINYKGTTPAPADSQ